MIHPGRLVLLAGLTLSACGGESVGPPPGPVPPVAGIYDVTGASTNNLGPQFTFVGTLVLTQADPPSETLGGTMTLTFSQSPKPWPTLTVTLEGASVDPDGHLRFLATTAAGTALWRGSVKGTAIVNGLFGCDECYSGEWRAQRQ